jgi:predicted TIM-barrel fold metal-dependent hydrolase
MFTLAPFACLLRVSKVDKIMYSVDYPFVPNENGLAFVEELEQSGLVNQEELELICHGNAERLLNVKAVS